MPRSVRPRFYRIDTRSERAKLVARLDPYYVTLQRGVAVGYYRPREGDGTWWGRVRANGRYVVAALATADDHVDADGEHILDWGRAQEVVRAWAARQTGTAPLTVATAIEDYLADLRARKGERAAIAAKGRLAKHVPEELRKRRVDELTAPELRAWRNSMVPTDVDEEHVRQARDTANRVVTILKAALNRAFNDGRVPDDKAWRQLKPFEAVGAARKIILDQNQIQALVDACEPGLRELVAVGAQTGARLGELTSARVRDFDASAGTLLVDGKTGAREIHLAPATQELLRRVVAGRGPGELLLPPQDRPAWTHNLHTKRFATAVRKAGLDPETTFYSLRHSYISNALKNLVPTKAVADHCGTSMAMIETHYAKFLIVDARRYAAVAAPELRVE
jgi:integrase